MFGLNYDTQLRTYFDLFGANVADYTNYISTTLVPGEDVAFAFTLAYDFIDCRKVWNAFYINLPMGFRGVDVDNDGNFIVAGYDGRGSEYILKHDKTGAIPDVWKYNVSVPG